MGRVGPGFRWPGNIPSTRWLGGGPPNTEDNALCLKGSLSRSWIELFLASHLQAIRRKMTYKELFEKKAEDVGIVLRDYEKV
jgi:hypothetical protein